ncbi:MAG: Type 1 glutamine amidotransferase-like domain-containing protein [Candidatus Nanopelagicaceae bacterium]
MIGSIALVGSGEYLPAMSEFENSLIEDGKRNQKASVFVQIPTAAGRESRDRILYWQELGRAQADLLGVEPRFLPIFDREAAHNPEFIAQINDSALIYMSGGDPHYLANTLRDTPVLDAIVENWNSGSSLAGCSAGAMVMSSKIPNFRISRSSPTEGFNLLPDIRVIPHFNKFFKWIPDSAAKVLLDTPGDSVLLGIDELTAMVRRNGEPEWQVHGEAKVHILKGLPTQQLSHSEKVSIQ